MIEIHDKKDCTGCNACFSICPKKCITMECDKEGFNYPKVDYNKCIKCNLCNLVCPLKNTDRIKTDRLDTPSVFASWNKNESIRLDSTSGGVFSELAYRMISLGGNVCGAVYNDNWEIEHVIVDTKEAIDKVRSSKYAQSEIGATFIDIKKQLDEDKKILICAAPCQIAGLYSFLNKDYDNLITCDFICRGVNSPKVFKGYLNDLVNTYKSDISAIKFKNKTYGWHRFATKVDFVNGKTYIKDRYNDSFMIGYLQYNAFMRPACYECKFKNIPRVADITLADFWGIENIDKSLDNNQGTSMVLINSEKGKKYFNSLTDNLVINERRLSEIEDGNAFFSQSVPMTKTRISFFEDIDSYSYRELSEKYFPEPNKLMKLKLSIKNIIKKGLGKV